MLYINDFCSIGPMGVFRPDTDISGWEVPKANNADRILYAREPDYREWIAPIKQRRMSKPLRMAVAAMKMCFGNDAPESIHIGSAFGQLFDSQRFLETIIETDKEALPPTSFIQSTHNTVSGALAMETGAHGHNFTFVNSGHSFEDAFFDAILTGIDLNPGSYQLVGAVDEMISVAAHAIRVGNCAAGALGEGCLVFNMSARREAGSLGRVMAFEKVMAPAAGQNSHQYFGAFLRRKHLQIRDTDLWMCGNDSTEETYDNLRKYFPNANSALNFKGFCGDYPTHSAFGLAYALAALNQQLKAGRVWIVTNYGRYWSLWLLEK